MLDCLHQGSKKDGGRSVGGEDKGFVPYEKAMKLLEQGPEDRPEHQLPFYPLLMELPKRCKDEKRPADQLVDHPQLDKTGAEVPIKYGAAVVALSMVESTLNEWAKPEVKVRF
ncbi:hypothetical protein Daus18300_002236 [Diaporthe australafricana]|uniref:Uncharacterized protein n=1 Tax=Diaporthe australafricana TaxID=127596 RepID=A0ABR3XPG5_9PEZI